MAQQTGLPQRRQFLSAEDFSFLEKKAANQHKSLEDTAAASGDVTASGTENKDGTGVVSKDSGIPINIDTVIAAEFSKLKKDAQINEVSNVVDNGLSGEKTTLPVVHKVTGVKLTASTSKPTPPPLIHIPTPQPDTSFLIPKSDLNAMVAQDSALKSLITSTTQKFKPTTSPKAPEEIVPTTHASNVVKLSNSVSTPETGNVTKDPVTRVSDIDTTGPVLTSVLEKTPQSIPLMVGGGLALFIIVLLVAIFVLLIRLKNKKGDISMRNESNRSNISKMTDASDMSRTTAATSRRESTDSNVYSEIGAEVRDDDIGDVEDDDDVIYYWGESEWDTESRHNSVLSLSYTTKRESGISGSSSGGRLSAFGVPKRGRRKSSLLAQCRMPGSSSDLRNNRQSHAGAIFSIPEGEDDPMDQGKRIEIKKDDLYKKVMKEKRSQSLF